VHKPSTATGSYYGADVAGPVFKRIAQKIFTDSPSTNEIKNLNKKVREQENKFNEYSIKSINEKNVVPNVKGMPAMDAVSLLENMGLRVKLKGNIVGKIKSQSISSGNPLVRNSVIELVVI
jgi:cell division protein FtsI (penicillin-binding protein 3)